MNGSPPERTIVLLGIGHTNAHIVRQWCKTPLPNARLICVSNFPDSTYSGMLPGVIAGNYRPEQMQIDLAQLCASARAELILDHVTRLDASRNQLLFEMRPPLPFDALSIGIGSVPRIDAETSSDAPVILMKPMQTFLDRLEQQIRSLRSGTDERPISVAVVGGGAAGVEICLCLPGFLHRMSDVTSNRAFRTAQILLIQGDDQLLPSAGRGLRHRVERELSSRGVDIRCGQVVKRIDGRQMTFDDESHCVADVILWATGATAPPLLGRLGLPIDNQGFLLTDETLKTTADRPIFAVGDSGTMHLHPVPKAGVYAVRQGPVLWKNLQRLLAARPLTKFRPQRQFLKLLNRGDGTAFGEYHGIAFGGRWIWRLKDWIDRRFVEQYQSLYDAENSRRQTSTEHY